MISLAVLHKRFTLYPCYLVLVFQLSSIKNNCLIFSTVLICVLIVKFSAFNCFAIGVVREKINLHTQVTAIYGA